MIISSSVRQLWVHTGDVGTDMPIWESPPIFSDGQPLSASAHLNTLAHCIQLLHDDALGWQPPLSNARYGSPWYGAIRHKYNSLEYKIHIEDGGTTHITYNGVEIVTKVWTVDGDFSGTVDLTSLGLTVNSFYFLEMTHTGSSGHASMVHIWEVMPASILPFVPTLISFTNETVPTAAEWQALSDYATAMHTILSHPYVPTLRTEKFLNEKGWIGTIEHRCQYLMYEFTLQATTYSESREYGNTARLFANGEVFALFHVQHPFIEDAPPTVYVENHDIPRPGEYTFAGALDLSIWLPSLVLGVPYFIELEADSTYNGGGVGDYTGGSHVNVDQLCEAPGGIDILTGWQSLPTWEHPDYVYGSTTAKQIQILKENLELLGSTFVYRNPACTKNRQNWDWRFAFQRRHRFLHYYCDEGADVIRGDAMPSKIGYERNGTQEATIPDGNHEWMMYDLDSAQGLYPGTNYLVTGARYAIEDIIP